MDELPPPWQSVLVNLFGWILPTAPHIRLGRQGERAAVRYLRSQGYRVLCRNIRIGRRDEVDVIAVDPRDRILVFVEVKARRRADPDYTPDLNLTPEKREAMARAARHWVSRHKYDGGYRLDCICVVEGAVTGHYEDVGWR